jgi:hemerythrin-like metal-binding protein
MDQGLLTGDALIDQQHAEVLAEVAKLEAFLIEGRTRKDEVADFVVYLRGHFDEHFLAEEELMRENGCPGFLAHQQDHLRMLITLEGHTNHIREHGSTNEAVLALWRDINTWACKHILTRDRDAAAFIRDRKGINNAT